MSKNIFNYINIDSLKMNIVNKTYINNLQDNEVLKLREQSFSKTIKKSIETFINKTAVNKLFAIEKVYYLFEILSSILLMLIFSPVLIIIALIIFFDSPGSILFKQIRVGQNRRVKERRKKDITQSSTEKSNNHMLRLLDRRTQDIGGRPFIFFKFRTMYIDAKERFPELYAYNYKSQEIETMKFKSNQDPRLTRAGKWLRKTSLDEIPNFLNVLTGDMSLVGPRPDIPQMVKYYKEHQKSKFKVKPGITGLAQINGRGKLNFQETLKNDIEYVETKSVKRDILIISKTIKSVLFSNGAF